MKIFRWVVISLALALCVAGWLERRTRRAAEEELNRVRDRSVAALAEARRLQGQAQSDEKDEADLKLGLERVKAARATGDTPPPRPNQPLQAIDVIARDPDLRAKYFATRRRTITTSYGPLMRQLKLGPEMNARFLDLLMDYEREEQDIVLAARIQGLTLTDPSVTKAKSAAWSELRAAQAELLGPEMTEQIRQYDRTLGVRAMVQPFIGASAYAGVPVSLDQADAMVRVIAEANNRYQQGREAEATQVDWALADQKLQSVLSPKQWELFRALEPVDGDASRWLAALNRAIADARTADRVGSAAPRPPSGG